MFVVFKDEFHVKMMLADGLISTREVLWLFCTFLLSPLCKICAGF